MLFPCWKLLNHHSINQTRLRTWCLLEMMFHPVFPNRTYRWRDNNQVSMGVFSIVRAPIVVFGRFSRCPHVWAPVNKHMMFVIYGLIVVNYNHTETR